MNNNKTKAQITNFLKISLVLLLLACQRNNDTPINCLSRQAINTEINLNLPTYIGLNNVGGFIYLNGAGTGSKGLIVVRNSTGFMVYDRNAPHICPDANTQLQVIDGIKLQCPKDQAEWILITGQPIKVTDKSPIMYQSNYDTVTKTLSIYN